MAETLAVSVESPPEYKLPRGGGGVLNHFVVRINYANFPYPISDLMLKYIYIPIFRVAKCVLYAERYIATVLSKKDTQSLTEISKSTPDFKPKCQKQTKMVKSVH